jgi:hypothetical protein
MRVHEKSEAVTLRKITFIFDEKIDVRQSN